MTRSRRLVRRLLDLLYGDQEAVQMVRELADEGYRVQILVQLYETGSVDVSDVEEEEHETVGFTDADAEFLRDIGIDPESLARQL